MKLKNFLKGTAIGLLASMGFIYFKRSKPNKNTKTSLDPLKGSVLAHRGLFNLQDKPENSLPAFKAALDQNYGIELDVQMTKDGTLVVFHDDSLKRMCGVDKILTDVDYKELKTYRLINSDCAIPTLEATLELIKGKVPLCIEIKQSGNYKLTTQKVIEVLNNYSGFFVIFSFSPKVLNIIKEKNPDILRGQLSTDYFVEKPELVFPEKLTLTYLLDNEESDPDLIIYNYHFFDKVAYQLFRILHPDTLTAVYTLKDQNQLNEARNYFNCYIFDSFIPDKK